MRRLAWVGLSAWVGMTMVLPAAAEAPPSTSLTLKGVIQQALEHNPQIVAARAGWEVSTEEIPQVRSLDDPSLYTMFWAVPHDTPNPFSAREVWLGIKQRFPYPGKLDLKGRMADTSAEMARQRYLSVKEEIIRQVRKAYFDLYLLYKEIEIAGKHLNLAREFAQIAEAKYATGTGTQGNVLKGLVEVADLANRIEILEQRRRTAEARLKALLDQEPGTSLGRPAEFALVPLVQTLEELQGMALKNRSERRATELAIDRSEQAIALARREYYPDFMADFAYWNVRDMPNRWMLMVEAKVPVAFWSKGRRDARVRQAQAEKRSWEASLKDLDNQILYAVEEAYAGLEIAADKVGLYQQTVLPQARQAVEALRIAYQTDQESFLSLVDSERRLHAFELEYHRARIDHEKSLADLERAVGAKLRPQEE
jgi:outer membrane protein TolC